MTSVQGGNILCVDKRLILAACAISVNQLFCRGNTKGRASILVSNMKKVMSAGKYVNMSDKQSFPGGLQLACEHICRCS